MWLRLATYTTLIDARARAETRADWLLTRLNQLELECSTLRYTATGTPQPVQMIHKDTPPSPADNPAETSFEDLGDDLARVHGVAWDDHGRVRVPA